MTQRKVIVRDAGHQALDELDATDIPVLDYEASGTVAGHTGDTSAAHAASAIAFTPNGSIAATDVQAAIQEVRDEAGGGVTDHGALTGLADDDHPQYTTDAEAGVIADASVATHAAAADPHTGYLKESDVSGFATPAVVLGTAAAAGAATTAVRTDATLLAFDATSPSTQAFGDAAAVGAATVAARRDHKHAMMAAPAAERAASSSTPAAVGTAAVGTGTTDARADHVHATGAGTPSTQAFGDAAATGSGPAAAMTDHKHAMPAAPTAASVAAVSVVDGGLETVNAVGNTGTSKTIALTTGNIQTFTVNGNCTFTMPSGLTSGKGIAFTVILTDSGGPRTITFTGVKWSGGGDPTAMSAASAIDIFSFLSIDGGTTWYGFVGGTGMAT